MIPRREQSLGFATLSQDFSLPLLMRSGEWNEQAGKSVLGRAMCLLEAFRPDDEVVSLSELARRTGVPKTTVHRLLQELGHFRVVEHQADGYRLGMRLFELGQRSPRARDLRSAALPFLGDLRDATHETVHLAVLDGAQVVYLEKLGGHHGPALPSRIGGRLPAHCTAVGKALLAFTPRSVVASLLKRDMERMTARSAVMPGLFLRELDRVRQEGVAYEHEESTKGVSCVACPVIGPDGAAVAAISVAGWVNQLDPARLGPAVRTAAFAISRSIDDADTGRVRLPRPGSPSRVG